MMGISYGGFTALQVAAHAPPHLTSHHPDVLHRRPLHRRLPLPRRPAAACTTTSACTARCMIAWNALPPDPEWSRDDWAADLGATTSPSNEPYLLKWLAPPDRRAVLAERLGRAIADRIACPAFLIGGWRDGYPNPPLRLYARACAAAEEGAGRAVEPRAARRRDPGPADRLPARGRALARPLVQGRRRTASWTSRRSSSTCRRPSRRSSTGSTRRASGGPRRPGRSPGASERVLHLRADGGSPRPPAPAARTSLTYHPAVGRHRRALVGRHPVRAAGRSAAGRGALAGLHLARRSTRICAILGRPRARPHRRLHGDGDRLRREPLATSRPTAPRTSSRRACSTSRGASR